MKTSWKSTEDVLPLQQTEMHHLVDQLIVASLPQAIKRNSLIINDVKPEIPVPVSKDFMALVLGNLINDAVNHTENDCIRISASDNGKAATIHMSTHNLASIRSFSICLETIQYIAEQFGGHVHFTNQVKNEMSVTVNFLNEIAA